jgi:hypothetical protein
MNSESYSDIRFKKVKSLKGRALEKAQELKLSNDALVVVRTKIGSLPEYEVEEVKGDPIEYLYGLGKKKQ